MFKSILQNVQFVSQKLEIFNTLKPFHLFCVAFMLKTRNNE